MQMSIFSSEEPHASRSASLACEGDWMIRVATWRSSILRWLTVTAPTGWYGRTSPASCRATEGRDFGAFVGALGELGYGWAYRILDAQYFGVAQRRRRVFVVGYRGDWRACAAVLFERHSLSGDTPPGRKAGETAPTIPSRSTSGGGLGTDFDCGLITSTGDVAHCLNAGGMGRQD